MRRTRTIITILVAAVLAMSAAAATVSARTPVRGTMDLQFNLGWPGPQAEVPDWVGTVTIDDTTYGMAFFAIGTGKPFDADPSTSVHFFEEIWTVYASLDYEFDGNGMLTKFDPGPVVLSGPDSGITNMVNSKYTMTGTVAEASGAFETLAGRPVHMSGVILWYEPGVPHYAPGELMIH